jgi:hypothetical protein
VKPLVAERRLHAVDLHKLIEGNVNPASEVHLGPAPGAKISLKILFKHWDCNLEEMVLDGYIDPMTSEYHAV